MLKIPLMEEKGSVREDMEDKDKEVMLGVRDRIKRRPRSVRRGIL